MRDKGAFRRFLRDAGWTRMRFFYDPVFTNAHEAYDGCVKFKHLSSMLEGGEISTRAASAMCRTFERPWGDQFRDVGVWSFDGTSLGLQRAAYFISDDEFVAACGLDRATLARIEGPELGDVPLRDLTTYAAAMHPESSGYRALQAFVGDMYSVVRSGVPDDAGTAAVDDLRELSRRVAHAISEDIHPNDAEVWWRAVTGAINGLAVSTRPCPHRRSPRSLRPSVACPDSR